MAIPMQRKGDERRQWTNSTLYIFILKCLPSSVVFNNTPFYCNFLIIAIKEDRIYVDFPFQKLVKKLIVSK